MKLSAVLLACMMTINVNAQAAEDNFEVIKDKDLRTIRYVPAQPSGKALILVHGFSRNAKRMAGHASALASQGVTVWTPNLYSLMGGAKSRAKNIQFLSGLVRKLAQDYPSVSLAGHSAGGALAFSTAIRAQQEGITVAQLVLLDAVPWEETIAEAGRLQALPLLSLTAKSSAMNAGLKIAQLHTATGFPFTHLHLVNSSHVDPENPPGFFARSLTTKTGQQLFAELLKRYVLNDSFEEYVAEQEKLGLIQRQPEVVGSG